MKVQSVSPRKQKSKAFQTFKPLKGSMRLFFVPQKEETGNE